MAPNKQGSNTSSRPKHGTVTKLEPIAQGAKIQKRPLNRRQLPASAKSRIIYVSSGTPFMSAVKRVRKQLGAALRSTADNGGAALKNASLHTRIDRLQRAGAGDGDGGNNGPIVTVMGTGKAVEKTLSVASWFEQQGDCAVGIKTRTVGTVDDVIVEGDEGAEDSSRVRKISCLEVTIQLR